jgi:hypothetical protein
VVAGNHAFLADGGAGLRVVDVSDPTEPREVGFYDTPGSACGVAVSGNNAYLAAGTYFGIYDCSEAMYAPSDPFILHPSSFILSAYPNPFNSTTTIRFVLPAPGPVHLEVYDLVGRRVKDLIPGSWLGAGEERVVMDADGMAGGSYWVMVNAAGEKRVGKVTVVK